VHPAAGVSDDCRNRRQKPATLDAFESDTGHAHLLVTYSPK